MGFAAREESVLIEVCCNVSLVVMCTRFLSFLITPDFSVWARVPVSPTARLRCPCCVPGLPVWVYIRMDKNEIEKQRDMKLVGR